MSKNQTARLAGFIYLIVIITGFFNLVYVPGELIIGSDATATVHNIIESELLFRLGIVTGVISYIAFALLPVFLFQLLSPVNRNHALLMLLLAVVSVPISIFNMTQKVDVLTLLSGAAYLNAFEVDVLHAQVMLLLKSYNNVIITVQIFWGLWLLPFGFLVYKSGFLPKILGVLLMLGCLGYVSAFFTGLLFTQLKIPYIGIPGALGEVGICLWLLAMGIRQEGDEHEDVKQETKA